MTTTFTAGEIVERYLAEVEALDLDELGSWDDPMKVAVAGSRDLLARALKVRAEAAGEATAQAVVDTPWNSEVRRRYPTHEADSLMILAWAARCDIIERPRREPLPRNLMWANRTLRRILKDGEASETGAARHPDRDLYSFLIGLADHSEQGSASTSAKTLEEFWAAIKNAPLKVLEEPLERLREDAREGRGTVTFSSDGIEKRAFHQLDGADQIEAGEEVEIFRQSFFLRNNFHVVVGARALHPGGVPLQLIRDGSAPVAKHFDLYAVWNLELPAEERGPIPPEAFLSLQGLFIPVDLRHQLYSRFVEVHQRFVEVHQWHQTAALAARNLSHNLGSHALLYIARELRDRKLLDEPVPETVAATGVRGSEVGRFLQYLVNRADLVAMLASGPGHTFSVVLPLKAAVEQFDEQRLLHRYLCASETLEVSTIHLLGGELSVDLPGGLIGGQALCAVLENFSRNSAKHSKRLDGSSPRIELELDARAAGDGLIECRLSDLNAASIGEEDYERLKAKVAGVIEAPAGPFEVRNPDLDVGLGIEEIATWLGYMRRMTDRRLWGGCTPPLMQYVRDVSTGRLALVFYLLKAVRTRRLAPGEHGMRGKLLPAQLTLVPCADRTQFNEHRRLPGRWLRYFRDASEVNFQSRFGPFNSRDPAWPAIEETEPVPSNLALAAYVETLRRFALGGQEPLNVVVIDYQWYSGIQAARTIESQSLDGWIQEVPTPHPLVRCFAADESASLGDAALPDDLAAALPAGAVAIWHRHGTWIPKLNTPGPLGDRVIHYEVYSGDWNYEYVTILSQQLLKDPEALVFLYGQLAEAALLHGVVIDERFARIHGNARQLLDRLRWMGVDLIDPLPEGAELADEGLPGFLRSIYSRRAATGSGRLSSAFVSIHASLKRKPELMKGMGWQDLLDIHGAPIPLLALHSGRGGVDEGRNLDYPFFPASLFQSWLFERPCKLFLSEALMRGGWI